MGLAWSPRWDDSFVLHNNLYGSSELLGRPGSNYVAIDDLPDGEPSWDDEDDEYRGEVEYCRLGVRYQPPAVGHSADEEGVDDPPTDTDPWPVNRRAARVPQGVPKGQPYRPRSRDRDRRAQPGSTRLFTLSRA